MLVQFVVDNFLSFKERHCIPLETGPYLRKYPNITFAVTPENYSSDIKLIKMQWFLARMLQERVI
ncbi:hypothetical protein MMJ59_03965 [Enterococcus cecorum]|uniref:hypothetical protein n=1 Tax=Enterococcus cecorum TaxID=44008 RepID=UPI00148B9AD5|nr:hypothetical protein [Enterococcus cecorum]MCJ0580094.1 hypothetical protein [Enterococcus cecorum]